MIQYLEKFFEMTSKPASLFIGLAETKRRFTALFRSLLHKLKMTDCNPSSVPADPGSRLTVMDCPLRSGTTPLSSTPYRSAVGGLMYAEKMTRPDILFAVTAASRYNQDPGNAHWAAVKRILSYLAGTINHGLCFGETDRWITLSLTPTPILPAARINGDQPLDYFSPSTEGPSRGRATSKNPSRTQLQKQNIMQQGMLPGK